MRQLGLFLAESVESTEGWRSQPAPERSGKSKSNLSVAPFLLTTGQVSNGSQTSETSAQQTLGASTLSAAGFRAKTQAPQAIDLASAVLKAAFGTSAPESLANFGHGMSSSKTLLAALLDGSTLSVANWQGSVMKRYRSRSAQLIAELRTCANESSLLPTLTTGYGTNRGGAQGRIGPVRHSLQSMVSHGLLTNANRNGEPPGSFDAEAQATQKPDWAGGTETEPAVVRMASRLPARMDSANARIKALGNSCTPQQAEVIGQVINILEQANELRR